MRFFTYVLHLAMAILESVSTLLICVDIFHPLDCVLPNAYLYSTLFFGVVTYQT